MDMNNRNENGNGMDELPESTEAPAQVKTARTGYTRRSASEPGIVTVRKSILIIRRIVLLLSVLLVIAAFIYGVITLFFKIETVKIEGNGHYTVDEVTKKLTVGVGDSIFTFNSDSVENRLLFELPFLKSAEITREFPSSVTVTLTDRVGCMYITLADDCFLLDKDLFVLKRADNASEFSGMIYVETGEVTTCIVGQEIVFRDSRKGEALRELYSAISGSSLNGFITSVKIENRFNIKAYYGNEFHITFGNINDIDIKTAFVARVIEKLSGRTGTIDVTDKKQAIFADFDD